MLAALAATLVVVLVGCTAVFGPRIVSFADAEPSPPEAVDWVSLVRRANAITASELPDFDPAQTRRLLDGPFRGGTLAVDLTPAEGGFCVSLTYALQLSDGTATDCVGAERRRAQPVTVIEPDGRARDETITERVREQGATSIVGWTTLPEATHAVVRFEDDTEREADRFLRVTAPIDAAFFTAEIPDELTHFPRRAVGLVVLDADGDEIGRQVIANADPDEWTFPRYGQGNGGFPPAADGSRAVLLRFPGTEATVRLAPAKGGVTCVDFRDRPGPSYGGAVPLPPPAGGSRADHARSRLLLARPGRRPEAPGHPVRARRAVRPACRAPLPGRYAHDRRAESGASSSTRSRHGTTPPGTRLVGARLLDADGRLVRGIVFDPTTRDLYPCDDPVDPGLGPPVCP